MMRVWRLSVAYIGPKSRTERPRKTKIGTEVAHVTRDPDITLEVTRSMVNLQGAGAYCGGLPHSFLEKKTRYWTELNVHEFARSYATITVFQLAPGFHQQNSTNEKSAQRDANTARWL